jgi:hypothetical protein
MPYGNQLFAAALAGLAVAALTSSASASSLNSVARELNANNEQRGCAATDKVLGDKFIVVDGRRYGGCLPVGSDKNIDAVRVLIKAATATGQWRDNQYGGGAERYLVIGDTSPKKSIVGAGTWNGQQASIRMDWDYRIPGVRFYVTRQGAPAQISVVSDPRVPPTGPTGHIEQPELFGKGGARQGVQLAAWKEQPVGKYAGPSDIPGEELLTLAYLMPSGVIHAGRSAADKMKLSKSGQNDVLTIPIAALGADLVATLNAKGEPVRTEINLKGKVYTGEFANFVNDRGDYEVYFPLEINLKRDGQVIADWDL